MPIALLALTICSFAIGTAEFVIVGLIPIVATDLGVSLPSAGLLVSLYAMGVAVGAPLLTAATGKVHRKILLISLMAIFTASNILAWASPSFETLVAARVLTGLAHGVFYSIATIIAAGLVPKEKAASAIAIMFTGLTVALVTGVPIGTFIGQIFGWRSTFLVVAALGAIAILGTILFVPSSIPSSKPATLRQLAKVLTHPRLILAYAITAIGYGGSFVAFTYLAPILEEISGFSAAAVSGVMLLYGVSVAAGNLYGGKLVDRYGAVPALRSIFLALTVVLTALAFTASSKWMMLITVLIWGAVAFGNVPGLQFYAVKQAERYVPSAVDVASGLNIAAFNLGIAGGASIGGMIVARGSLTYTPLIAAIFVFLAFALTVWAGFLDRRKRADHLAEC